MFLRVLILLTAFVASHVWGQAPPRNLGAVPARPAAVEQRFALAIGINDYREVGRLEKAVNDSRAVGHALEQAGFRVVVLTNARRAEMNRAINQFVLNLSGGGQGVFFFAGHGVQINNHNYLLPVDVQAPQVEVDVADQAISLQGIQDKLAEVRARFALLVVDACRDNPLPRKAGRTLGGTRGLAQASSAEGQMVVFSAGANQQALDKLSPQDANPNGVFTREFLPWIGKPGVSVRDAVLQVRSAVRARARSVNHEQFPAVYDQVDGNFYFLPGGGGALAAVPSASLPAPAPALQPAPSPAPDAVAVDPAEAAFWAEARRLDDPAAYAAYLSAYPQGRHIADARAAVDQARRAQEARQRLAEEQAWARAEAGASAASYAAYLGAYPNGRYAALAKLKRERLGGGAQDCAECPEMVAIPAGSFLMGSPASEAGRDADEGPQRQVRLAGFAMGKTEITRAQFGRFVAASGHVTDAERNAGGFQGCYAWQDGKWDWRAGVNWRNLGFAQGEDHPAVCLSWNDAQAYVRWLSAQTGQDYRLPSEAQWEYAARAGSTGSKPWGESPDEACRHANVADQTRGPGGQGRNSAHQCSDGHSFTAPVGRYQPNAFGLHDMIGNAWEWTQDCYADSYSGAPVDGSAQADRGCERRVLRGGSWRSIPGGARSARRHGNGAADRNDFRGFRVVRLARTP
jgi:formylglycine-generating enzyme required for sulfatase activity